jgi:putative hemolysin
MKPVYRIVSVWMLVITAGCMGPEFRGSAGDDPAPRSPIANPAVENCLKHGFVAEPVMENGVPVDHRCVDPDTDRSCGVWEYYRNTCTLPDRD